MDIIGTGDTCSMIWPERGNIPLFSYGIRYTKKSILELLREIYENIMNKGDMIIESLLEVEKVLDNNE